MSSHFRELLKKGISGLPEAWQLELRRIHYARAIRRGRFRPDEPEDDVLASLVRPGDWVIDVGANVGHYAKRLSDLVGPSGRVIAIEPVPATFSLLVANAAYFAFPNLTFLNVAASDGAGEADFAVPRLATGLKNYYRSSIVRGGGEFKVVSLPLDALSFDRRIALVKIDVEGHEAHALHGMSALVARDRPTLIVETRSDAVLAQLRGYGYETTRIGNSPNVVARRAA